MKLLKLAAIIGSLSLLGGCSAFNVGEEPPECGVGATGIDCVSAREVWAATDTYSNLEGMTAAQVRNEAARNDPNSASYSAGHTAVKDDCDDDECETTKVKSDPWEHNTAANKPLSTKDRSAAYGRYQEERLHLPSADPLAVRSTPDILRITIAPYQNENDVLVMPVQYFAEVEKRKWIIGDKASTGIGTRTPAAVRALSRSATMASQSTPSNTGGMGVSTRQPAQEFNFEGVVPPEAMEAAAKAVGNSSQFNQ
ncbi:TraV family lipoprotein [Vibrio rotiferianus]